MKRLILFATSISLCFVLWSGVVLAQVPTPGQIADDATKEWQSDFKMFVETLRDCARVNCPVANFKGAKVTWEGTFTSWDTKRKTGAPDIDMGLDDATLIIGGTTNKLVCCSPSVIEPAEWKALKPGSKVKFQATLNSLVPIMVFEGHALILLEKATIVGPTSNKEGQNKQQSENVGKEKIEEQQTFSATAEAEQIAAAVKLASAGVSSGMNLLMALSLPDVNTPERTASRKNDTDAAREITGGSFGGPFGAAGFAYCIAPSQRRTNHPKEPGCSPGRCRGSSLYRRTTNRLAQQA